MAETFRVGPFRYAGEKDNPHGGKLHKFYCTFFDGNGDEHKDVYWQRKNAGLGENEEVYGHIEQGEYGPRFKTDQRPDGSGNQGSSGGTFNRHFERVPDNSDRSRRIERQHSQEMALRFLTLSSAKPTDVVELGNMVKAWTDHFQQDLDADVGGGNGTDAPLAPAADVSAVREDYRKAMEFEEAPPQLKGKATQLMNKAGLAKGARQAVILFRCGTLKAPPKDRLLSLVKDLEDGATHDTLLAEVHDAARAGNNPLATKAAAMIPPSAPLAPEPVEVEPSNGEEIPF